MKEKHFIDSPEDIEELFPLVVKECELIKENFTSEEIAKLELDEIDPTSPHACIYGTMVGDCNSKRVNDFINSNLDIVVKTDSPMEEFHADARARYYVTPLEEYIYTDKYGNEEFDKDEINNGLSLSTINRIEKVINLLK